MWVISGFEVCWCFLRRWWIIRQAPVNAFRAGFFVSRQSGQATSSRSEAPSECLSKHLHPTSRDMILLPHVRLVALKRKLLARGRRAPHAPSIVGWFSLLPWQGYIADSVAQIVCPLVLAAARASPAALHGDARSDSTHATTPDGRVGMEPAAPSPRCDEEAAAIP